MLPGVCARRPRRERGTGGGRRRLPLVAASLWVSILLGCGSPSERPLSEAPVSADRLATSLIVQVKGDGVVFILQVTNAGASPVSVTFPTAQAYDFVVWRGGERVWSWSADRMFAQVIREETLAPEETWRYEAPWAPASGEPGEYEVEARLASSSHPLKARAEFQLP